MTRQGRESLIELLRVLHANKDSRPLYPFALSTMAFRRFALRKRRYGGVWGQSALSH